MKLSYFIHAEQRRTRLRPFWPGPENVKRQFVVVAYEIAARLHRITETMLLPFSATTTKVGFLTALCILLLSKFGVVVVEARGEGGGPCRVQDIDALWVEPALGDSTHYAATLQINILFASDSTEEDRATLDLGSSLHIWTSPSSDNGNSKNATELSFEHFEQAQRDKEISMIVKTNVPNEVPSIEMSVEKDGNTNYCYSIGSVLLDKQPCIDVHSAVIRRREPKSTVHDSIPAIADTRSGSSSTPQEYHLTVNLRPTDTKLARTNQRLPPTDDIGWRLSTDSEDIQDYTLLPKEKTNGNSVTLTFEGSVRTPYIQDGISISAYDKTRFDFKPWACGNYLYAELLDEYDYGVDDSESKGSTNCFQQPSSVELTEASPSASSLSHHTEIAQGFAVGAAALAAVLIFVG